MSSSTAADRVKRFARRRPGVLGALLLVPTWIALGALCLLYVIVVTLLAFAAVVVHTARLFLGPPLRLLGRLTGWTAWRERVRLRRYAQEGVEALERDLAQERTE